MEGVARIDRVAALFEAWTDDSFPFAKFKIKVLERRANDLLAVSNVLVRNITSGEPEYVSGLGSSVEEAVSDLLTRFMAGVRENTPPTGLTEDDFEWSAYEDF